MLTGTEPRVATVWSGTTTDAFRPGAVLPFPFPATAVTAATAPIRSKMITTSRMIFIQLHGRSPDTLAVRPLIKIWNRVSWYR